MSRENLSNGNTRSVIKGSFVDNDCDRPSSSHNNNSAAKPRKLFTYDNNVSKKERTLSPNNDVRAQAQNKSNYNVYMNNVN